MEIDVSTKKMIKSIVHICQDEKFTNGIVVQFEHYSQVSSKFFILRKPNKPSFTVEERPNVFFFNSEKKIIEALKRENCDVVFLHSLFLDYKFIKKISNPIILCTWGFDIYSDSLFPPKKRIHLDLFKPYTKKILTELEHKKNFYHHIKQFVKKILGVNRYKNLIYNKSIEKAVAISTILPCEFDLLNLPSKTFCPFQYRTLNKSSFPNCVPSEISLNKKRILVGNSLDPSNNHIDILHSVNDLNDNIEVVLPINYAGNKDYKEALKSRIQCLNNIKPILLETFMEKTHYFALIDSCQSAIFGHVRQQAIGNISHMLATGKKIFLYKDSIAFKHLKKCGYHIFSIEDDMTNDFVTSPLSIREIEENNALYRKIEDIDLYIDKMNQFFINFET